jgi:ArsR family transcriptional regulator
MSAVSTPCVSQTDKMFRAFADRTRLRILCLLQDGELCVSDIISILKVPQAKASHHLNYLRRAGLVETRKAGLWNFYRLRPSTSPFHEKLLECLGQCFTSVPGLAADRGLAAKLKASGGCCQSDYHSSLASSSPSADLLTAKIDRKNRTTCVNRPNRGENHEPA